MLTQWQNLVVCTSLPGDAPAMTWLGDHMICQRKGHKIKQNTLAIYQKQKLIKNSPQWPWNTRPSLIYWLFRPGAPATMPNQH